MDGKIIYVPDPHRCPVSKIENPVKGMIWQCDCGKYWERRQHIYEGVADTPSWYQMSRREIRRAARKGKIPAEMSARQRKRLVRGVQKLMDD